MEIRALLPGDDRAAFKSGDSDLDRFFHRFAGQNQFRHHIGTTYVAVDQGAILGFATIAPGQVEIAGLPQARRQGLPRYPLPILRLARLGVAASAQGRGIGSSLLRFTLGLARRLARDYGCVGVVVDAKPGAISFYSRYGFVELEVVEGGSEVRPMPTTMFLPLSEVEAASGEAP